MRHSLALAFCVMVVVALCSVSEANAPTSAHGAQNKPERPIDQSSYGVAPGERVLEVNARLSKLELIVSTNHEPTSPASC
jgi:hypothetical protein